MLPLILVVFKVKSDKEGKKEVTNVSMQVLAATERNGLPNS